MLILGGPNAPRGCSPLSENPDLDIRFQGAELDVEINHFAVPYHKSTWQTGRTADTRRKALLASPSSIWAN